MNAFMLAALNYEASGFSVIPLKPKDKIPLVPSWLEFQQRRATREEIGQWWRNWADANIGIVTGSISQLLVIDADSREAANGIKAMLGNMADVAIVTTGKGFHLYYRYGGRVLHNKAAILPQIDFRGDGGYVVAPPSIHPNGAVYVWARALNGHLPQLPAAFEKLLIDPPSQNQVGQRFDTAGALAGLPEGQRDQGLFKLAAKLRGADVPYEMALELCEQAAANCIPPFREAKRKVDQAYKYAPGHSQAQQPSQVAFWPEPLSAQELIDLPPDPTRWVWSECLPLRATSALIAKSYTGKSTFACSLSLAVARGIEFLGRPTQQGNVLYVYLDGPIDELKENLINIGLSGSDPVFVYAGRKPDQVIEWVSKQCSEKTIKLLIVDTAQKFFGFKEDKYEEKINKMQPMLDLVDQYNFHAMFTYHAAKASANTITALGSVAVEANARVSLYLRKLDESNDRIFDTMQNSGKAFASIGLSDPAEGFITKTGTLYEIEIKNVSVSILTLVQANPGLTEADIRNEIQGRHKITSIALRKLVDEGQIERTGTGRKGDARKHHIAGSLVSNEDAKEAKVIDLFTKKNGQNK